MAAIEVTENDLIAAILAASVPTPRNPHGAKTTAQIREEYRQLGEPHSEKWICAVLKMLKQAGRLGVTTILSEALNGRYQPIAAYYLIKDK